MAGYCRYGSSLFPQEWELAEFRKQQEELDKAARKRIYDNNLFSAYQGKVCWLCKQNVVAEGQVYCAECKSKMKSRYALRKDASKCVRCGKPAIDGETRCQHCKDMVNAARRIRRARKRNEAERALEE